MFATLGMEQPNFSRACGLDSAIIAKHVASKDHPEI